MNTATSIQTKAARADSLHSVVGGRSNPKRLAELAKVLNDLRCWADIEGSLHPYGTSEKQIWREVGEWADGTAMKYKLNLAAVQSEQEGARVPQATPDANGEARLETRLSAGGVESSNKKGQP